MKKGDKVNINPNGNFPNQGLDHNKNPLVGTIIDDEIEYSFDFEVKWSDGDKALYDKSDLILLNQSQDYEIY